VVGLFAFLIIVLFFVVVPIWALLRTLKLKRESATRDELGLLTRRIYELERNVDQLHGAIANAAATLQPEPAPAPPVAAKEILLQAAAPPPETATEKPPEIREARLPTPSPAPPTPPAGTGPAAAGAGPQVPSLLAGATRTARARDPRQWADLEERLGANWLNKIGIVVLVFGVAFFLNYTMRHLGPAGKIAVGYALGVFLIVLGDVGVRHDRYRITSRAVLGGGWAIAYFTTYALHNVAAVRVVESAALGFALLFAVTALMVEHSLRYNSQVATGFAYLLGFAGVAVSRITVGTLGASVVLAASLVVVLWRRRWYAIEPPAVLATYAVHWIWLQQIFDALGGHKPFPELRASVALLTLYWLVWMVSYFLRDPAEAQAQKLLTLSFLFNAGGYLAVMRYQSLYPQLRFWFLIVTGAAYLGLAALSKRLTRREGFILTSTLGAALAAAAIPYRYSGGRLEIIWLVEAEAFLVAGWRLVEAHLRKLGWALLAALTIYVTLHDLSPRLARWRAPDAQLGWTLLALAAGFYLNAWLAPRLLQKQSTETDVAATTASDVLATGFLLAAAWVALPFMWVGLAWVALAALLGEAGRWDRVKLLRDCGHGAALLALLRLMAINLPYAPAVHDSMRLLTVGLSAAIFYFASQRFTPPATTPEAAGGLRARLLRWGGWPAAYTGSATLLAALLIWKEVTNTAIGLGWALFGLALVEIARARGDRPLRAQGHALLALSFARIFIADLNAAQRLGGVSARLVTVTLLAAIYYYAAFTSEQDAPRMRSAFFWFGAGALAALARFELAVAWVAVGWAALAVVAYLAGRRLGVTEMRYQAYLLTLLVGARCAFDNFYQKGPWRFTNTRTVTVSTAAALLYLLLAVALVEKRRRATAAGAANPPAPAGATSEAGRG
jgi:hypothetical protein